MENNMETTIVGGIIYIWGLLWVDVSFLANQT